MLEAFEEGNPITQLNPPLQMRMPAIALVFAAAILGALDSRAEQFEAVTGRISGDYVRALLPNGTPKPETYAFGKGGFWSGPLNDKTIDKMEFIDVAKVMAVPLADQHYIPSKDANATKLLIMVYWGTTFAPEHASESGVYQHLVDAEAMLNRDVGNSALTNKFGRALNLEGNYAFDAVTVAIAAVQAENRLRDNVDRRNAMMLGYDSWWLQTFDAPNGTPMEREKRDMLNELEEYRYFVVLMAYDFQLMWKEKKHKLLWETRFSIREHVNAFDKQLPAMALGASKYFGRDSKGLTHDTLPEGQVGIGDIRNLGVVPEK
jgi:hypothetical protein